MLYFIVYSPTSTTLFPVLSKHGILVLSFEYLTDNSNETQNRDLTFHETIFYAPK
jgi:hypothetical protein